MYFGTTVNKSENIPSTSQYVSLTGEI